MISNPNHVTIICDILFTHKFFEMISEKNSLISSLIPTKNNSERYFEYLSFMDPDDDYILFQGIKSKKRTISPKWIHHRMKWNLHVVQLLHKGYFNNEYCMSHAAWIKLHTLLKPRLQRQYHMSRGDEPISVNMVMAAGMRYLSGTNVNGICHIFHMSRAEAYRSINSFITSVLQTDEIGIKLPKSREQWSKVRDGFSQKSYNGVFYGTVGAIDGLFVKTIAPSRLEVGNVCLYFSGHYEHYGLNVQAVCDSNLKFLFFGVIGPLRRSWWTLTWMTSCLRWNVVKKKLVRLFGVLLSQRVTKMTLLWNPFIRI